MYTNMRGKTSYRYPRGVKKIGDFLNEDNSFSCFPSKNVLPTTNTLDYLELIQM